MLELSFVSISTLPEKLKTASALTTNYVLEMLSFVMCHVDSHSATPSDREADTDDIIYNSETNHSLI